MKKQREIINSLSKIPKLRVKFTSITETYFSGTLALFIEILQLAIGRKDEEMNINFNFIKRVFEFLQFFKTENNISYNNLRKDLFISENKIHEIIDVLVKKEHIIIKPENDDIILSITSDGRDYYTEILNRFDIEKFKDFKEDFLGIDVRPTRDMLPFLGFFLSDKDGKTLITTEVYEGALKDYFTNNSSDNPMFDVELIPMFISALEKFSQEINIEDLNGFKLVGKNQTMHIFGTEVFTFTIFSNPNINMKSIKSEIQTFFENMIQDNRDILLEALSSGYVDPINPIAENAKKWLDNLNHKYKDMVLNLNLIDFDQAKLFYDRLDSISEEIRRKYDNIQAQVRKLKVELMKSILDDNIENVRKISKEIQALIKKHI